jgi:hypothetical protein
VRALGNVTQDMRLVTPKTLQSMMKASMLKKALDLQSCSGRDMPTEVS